MLTVKRPTPTTVLYNVSTRSPRNTWPSKLTAWLLTALRILAGIQALVLILIEYASYAEDDLSWAGVLDFSQGTVASPFHQIPVLLYNQHFAVRAGAIAALAYFATRKGYIEESLLVIRGLGVQTSTSSPSYFWTTATRFIPTSNIQDIFIHEAFKGFEVRFYLAIVVEGEEDLVVVFPSILPRMEVLEDVWRGARACLYEPKS